MNSIEEDLIKQRINDFDDMINMSSTTQNFMAQFGKSYKLNDIFELFLKSKYYEIDKVEQVANLLIDIRMQQFFIEDFDMTISARILDMGFVDLKNNPKQVLYFLSIFQTIVVQSRILFERIINFTVYVVTGKHFDVKNNKKAKFFKKLKESDEYVEWKFILNWEELIKIYDDKFRGPEVHKNSTLRKYLFDESTDRNITALANQIIMLINNISNNFCRFIIKIFNNEIIEDELLDSMKKNIDNAIDFISIKI